MSIRRKLDGLEQRSPAALASQNTLDVLPDALRAAVGGAVGARETLDVLHSLPEWRALLSPFPARAAGPVLHDLRCDRLGAFLPELERVAGPETVRLFLSILAFTAAPPALFHRQ